MMHIRFGCDDTERVEGTLKTLDRGETDPYFECVYRDEENLHRMTRPKNLELLRALAGERPESIRDTARIVEFEEDGRSKRPSV
jgi:predicted transcriptional regulator